MNAPPTKNLSVRREGDVLIVVHNDKPPLDAEWDVYLDAFRLDPGPLRFQLVFTDGGGPNAAQRKRAVAEGARAFGSLHRPIPASAVMTPSPAMRGLVTLFNWLFPGRYRAFEPGDFHGALSYLNKPPEAHARFRALVEAMRKELD